MFVVIVVLCAALAFADGAVWEGLGLLMFAAAVGVWRLRAPASRRRWFVGWRW